MPATSMACLAYLILAMCAAVAVAETVDCWGSGTSSAPPVACRPAVTCVHVAHHFTLLQYMRNRILRFLLPASTPVSLTPLFTLLNRRFDRLKVHTLLIAPQSDDTGKVLFSGIHFPNIDGQPPGAFSLKFV